MSRISLQPMPTDQKLNDVDVISKNDMHRKTLIINFDHMCPFLWDEVSALTPHPRSLETCIHRYRLPQRVYRIGIATYGKIVFRLFVTSTATTA